MILQLRKISPPSAPTNTSALVVNSKSQLQMQFKEQGHYSEQAFCSWWTLSKSFGSHKVLRA